jgi:hypothetical protein
MIGACNALLATRVINITKLNYMGQFTDIRAKNICLVINTTIFQLLAYIMG